MLFKYYPVRTTYQYLLLTIVSILIVGVSFVLISFNNKIDFRYMKFLFIYYLELHCKGKK